MSNFTFLTKEQCFGSDRLDIFEKRGTEATITDFSILLGGEVGKFWHVENDDSLGGRTGYYWTKSDNGYYDAYGVHVNGYCIYERVDIRKGGARLALPFSSSISSIPTNGKSWKRAKDGIIEVEYGYYPQEVASKDMQKILEIEFKRGRISKTSNSYTTDSTRMERR